MRNKGPTGSSHLQEEDIHVIKSEIRWRIRYSIDEIGKKGRIRYSFQVKGKIRWHIRYSGDGKYKIRGLNKREGWQEIRG